MIYQEFIPGEQLKAFVKCYYLCEYDTEIVVQDRAFATGSMEIMFNLGNGAFETGRDNSFTTTPKAELWGQIITPLDFRSLGKNKILGVRFYPHTASAFLDGDMQIFNDQITDFAAVDGAEARMLHDQLLHASALNQQITLLETYLIRKLNTFSKKNTRFGIVNNVINEMQHEDFCDDIRDVALRYGISSRYLQKLFLQFTGLTPKLYYKIYRFQKSLVLTRDKNESLTSIAYQSGYFDQSHFVRDFKLFTGLAPSAFDPNSSTAILASPNK